MEYYLAIKNKHEILTLAATWKNLKGVMPSETNQREKDKHCMILFRYGKQRKTTNE